jgi:transcriptional regulator with XRE-family HTH domain
MTHLRVKELAEAQGLNIQTLANKADLMWPTVAGYWHDRNEQFNRTALDKIAAALGVRVSDLFGGEPQAEKGS